MWRRSPTGPIVSAHRKALPWQMATAEVTTSATDRFNAEVRRALDPTVWKTGVPELVLQGEWLSPFDLATLKSCRDPQELSRYPDLADYSLTRSRPVVHKERLNASTSIV